MLSKELVQQIVNYLEKRPFGEVANLISEILSQANKEALPKEDVDA